MGGGGPDGLNCNQLATTSNAPTDAHHRPPPRLKSAGGSKTIEGLQALGCPRRAVLTGTPVQNNLEEFYALLSFASPGVLGPMGTFKRVYAGGCCMRWSFGSDL